MKKGIRKLLSTILVLAMLLEALPANLLGLWVKAAGAEELSTTGFSGIPQPNTLMTVVPLGEDDLPNTIIIGEEKESVNQHLFTNTAIQENQVAPAYSSVEDGTENEDAIEDVGPIAGISAPYDFDAAAQEQINLNNGDLIYRATDYVLPGINGLDLSIGRNYNSRYASRYGNTVRSWFVEDTPLNYSVLGHGWDFAFSSITQVQATEASATERWLRLHDGTMLRLSTVDDNGNVKLIGYSASVVSLKRITNHYAYPAGPIHELTYVDGRIETFDHLGRLVKIEDGYDYMNSTENKITFSYDTANGFERITITDTLNRQIVISSAEDGVNHIVTTVELPNNITLTYRTLQLTSPFVCGVLESYTDPVNQTEHYSYTLEESVATSDEDFSDYHVNLTTVTHPTGAQTKYSYEKYTSYIKYDYWEEITRERYRISERYDLIGNEVHNQKEYTYTERESSISNYPAYISSYQYGVTVECETGVTEEYCFGIANKTGIYIKRVFLNGSKLSETNGDYGYTKKYTTVKYNDQTSQDRSFTTAARTTTRDRYGRITEDKFSNSSGVISRFKYNGSQTQTQLMMLDGEIGVMRFNWISDNKITESEFSKGPVLSSGYINSSYIQKRTRYTYDEYGNKVLEEVYGNAETGQTSNGEYIPVAQYEYQDNAFLSKVTYTNVNIPVQDSEDGNTFAPAEGSPGQDAGTIVLSYAYDSFGRMTSETDGNGYTTTYAYDALGNTTQINYPDGNTVKYDWDYANNTVTVEDENGYKTRYTYTPLGLPQDTIAIVGNNSYVLKRQEYDNMSRLSRVTDYVYGSVTEYTYDGYGNVASETVKQGDAILSRTTFVYNEVTADGLYLKNTKTVHGNGSTPDIVTTEYIDQYGNVVKTGRVIGGVEYCDTYTHDHQGNVLTVLSAADSAKGLSFTEKYEYTYDGQISKTYNANNQVITNTYDYLGNLIETTDYSGTPTTYTYDILSRLTSRTITTDPGTTVTTTYEYDPAGNLIRESWPTWNTTSSREYVYGSRNQRLQTVELYDWEALATSTSYTYDGVGNMLSMTTQGKTTSYEYDRYGNVTKMTDGLGKSETFTYTDLGKLVSKTDRNGSTITYGHDAVGRLVAETAGNDYRRYTYAPNGQLASEENNWYRTNYTYDSAGRAVGVTETELMSAGSALTDLQSYTKTYAYDSSDNRTNFTLTRGGTVIQDVDYTYDTLNRLSTVSEDGTIQAAYTYDTDGNRASLTYPNGIVESYTYNESNWVTGVYNKLGDTVLSSYTYAYDTVGNQTSKTDHTGKKIYYTYDGLGRLENEWDNSTDHYVDYFYDASQNRSSMYVDNGDESYRIYYTYDANNRLTQERKYQDGTYTTIATYTYDDNGNLLTKTGADGTAAYTYNGFNQQTGYTVGTTTSAYAYNAKGIRTAKTIGADRTSYLLDGSNVVTEVKNNAVSANYIRGTNLISKEADNSTSYYLYNAHGDVIGLTNNTGSVTKAYDYDAFGIEKNPNTADTNPFRYCGEYYDTETGKYYLRARYYDPSLGRFTQADSVQYVHRELPNGASIIDPLSLNLYAYSANNPIKYCDPSGNAFEVVLDVISAVDSAVTFALSPTLGNAVMLAWDIGGAILPFVPGSYVAKAGKIIKIAGFTDEIADGAKLIVRADKSKDVAKVAAELSDGAVQIGQVTKRASSARLAKNLGGRQAGMAAHHIVAEHAVEAMDTRAILRKFGIDIDDAINGVFLPSAKGTSGAAYHRTLHTDAYYAAINNRLKTATTQEQAIEILQAIKKELENGTFMTLK